MIPMDDAMRMKGLPAPSIPEEAEMIYVLAERDATIARLQAFNVPWFHLHQAAEKIIEEPEIARQLRVFVDYWGLDAYTPPAEVERNVRDLVHAFLLAAMPSDAALSPEGTNDAK